MFLYCIKRNRFQKSDEIPQDTDGFLLQMQEVYLKSTFDEVLTKKLQLFTVFRLWWLTNNV